MRAATAGPHGKVEWIEVDEPTAGVGEVLLRPLACGVCTSDVKRARAGYEGGPRYALGHELVGEVVAAGGGAKWQPGDRVVAAPYISCGSCYHCQHGQPTLCAHLFENSLDPGGLAERVRIPRLLTERGLFRLPEGLSVEAAALAEPIGCCIQAVETCGISRGDSVLVVGDGPMGLMNAAVARVWGASPVIVAGMTPHRLARAREGYADVAVDVNEGGLRQRVTQVTGGRGADVVIVAVSSAEAVQSGLASLRAGGVLNVFAGVPATTALQLDLHRLHYEQLRLTGSFGVGLSHMAQALRLLAGGQINGPRLITCRLPFERTPQAVAYAAERAGLKAMVVFEEQA